MLVTGYGVKVATIKSIVAAKLSYNRPKDWIQLMQLSHKIFEPAKFKASLMAITTAGADDEYDIED